MDSGQKSTWQPIEGLYATRYMFIMVVSLAITVVGTRLFLEATGYPQIGNETFHIAHALWGGLFQAVAVTLVLIYRNEWILVLSSAFAGIGIGLFVDEIGKFITQANDYFFPLAAPLIYITIMLCVWLFLYIRREDQYDARGTMYIVLERLKSLLDGQIDRQEYEMLRLQLTELSNQTERHDIASMAQGLMQALPDDTTGLPVLEQGFWSKILDHVRKFEAKHFGQVRVRRILKVYLSLISISTLLELIFLIVIVMQPDNIKTLVLLGIMQNNPLVTDPASLVWFLALIVLSLCIGILYLIALIYLLRGKEVVAIRAGMIGLLLSLTIGSTLSFYFNQFSVMLSVIFSTGLLILVVRYRDRFLQDIVDSKSPNN